MRELSVIEQLLLFKQYLVALFLSKVQEMTLFSALDDVFAEDPVLKDALFQEVELSCLEGPDILSLSLLLLIQHI